MNSKNVNFPELSNSRFKRVKNSLKRVLCVKSLSKIPFKLVFNAIKNMNFINPVQSHRILFLIFLFLNLSIFHTFFIFFFHNLVRKNLCVRTCSFAFLSSQTNNLSLFSGDQSRASSNLFLLDVSNTLRYNALFEDLKN